jgi:hypothetical protein
LRCLRPSLALDLDAPGARLLRLGDPDVEHPVLELRLHPLRVHLARKRHAVLEAPDPTGAAAQEPLADALLDLAVDGELVVAQLDVDVLAPDSRQLGLDDPGILGLLDVDQGRPYLPVADIGSHALHQLAHLLVELLEIVERLGTPLDPTRRSAAHGGN